MRGPWDRKENKDISMKLNPSEIHAVQRCVDYEVHKKRCEGIIEVRIDDIVRDYREIVWPDVYNNVPPVWVYSKENVWQSLEENGDIRIIFSCSMQYPLTHITQDMLISDDWQEEFKKKMKKAK